RCAVVVDATADAGHVAAQGAVSQCERAIVVDTAATESTGDGVAGYVAAADRQHPPAGVVDTAAVAPEVAPRVLDHGAVVDSRCAGVVDAAAVAAGVVEHQAAVGDCCRAEVLKTAAIYG